MLAHSLILIIIFWFHFGLKNKYNTKNSLSVLNDFITKLTFKSRSNLQLKKSYNISNRTFTTIHIGHHGYDDVNLISFQHGNQLFPLRCCQWMTKRLHQGLSETILVNTLTDVREFKYPWYMRLAFSTYSFSFNCTFLQVLLVFSALCVSPENAYPPLTPDVIHLIIPAWTQLISPPMLIDSCEG